MEVLMSKTMNTDLKFTTDTESAKIGDNPNSFTTTTGTSSSTAFNYSDLMRCKYYLPCGRCDKTGELCTYYTTPTYPYYPYPYRNGRHTPSCHGIRSECTYTWVSLPCIQNTPCQDTGEANRQHPQDHLS